MPHHRVIPIALTSSLLLPLVMLARAVAAEDAASLPLDSKLLIPAEDTFDTFAPVEYEHIKLYPVFPESWPRQELTGTWRVAPPAGSAEGNEKVGPTDDEIARKAEAIVREADPEGEPWQERAVGARRLKNKVNVFATTFVLPKDFSAQKRRCLLYFETEPLGAIFVNGVKLEGEERGRMWCPLRLDVSEAARPGRNVVAIYGLPVNREAEVVVAPTAYVSRMLVDPQISTSSLNVRLIVDHAGDDAKEDKLRFVVTPWKGAEAAGQGTLALTLKPGRNWLETSVKMPSPTYWTPDNPFLYEIRVYDAAGECLGQERFGFREFVTKGRYFYLNGERINLYGMQWNSYVHHGRGTPFLDSESKIPNRPALYEKVYHTVWLSAFKEANLNSFRLHSGTRFRGRGIFEACDEVGILHYDDWETHSLINRKAPGSVREYLADEFQRREAWLYFGYNHPSTVMYSFGNERYSAPTENLDALYHFAKPLDRQRRPMCNSSGRIPQSLILSRRESLDFGDDHCYWGSMRGSWLYNREYFRMLREKMDAMYGKDTKPLVNFELGGGFYNRYTAVQFVREANAIAMADRVDRKAFVQVARKHGEWGWEVYPRLAMMSSHIRTYYADEVEMHRMAAEGLRRIWDIIRQDNTLEGIGPHQLDKLLIYPKDTRNCLAHLAKTVPGFRTKSVGIDPSVDAFVRTPGFHMTCRYYQPEMVSARWFDRNLIAGEGRVTADIYAINDTSGPRTYAARVLFRAPDRKTLHAETLRFDEVAPFGRRTVAIDIPVPAGAKRGEYRLELFLFRDQERIADNWYPIHVFTPEETRLALATEKRIACYPGSGPVAGILKRGGATSTPLKDPAAIGKDIQVLVIEKDGIDEALYRAGDAIAKWVKAGGRLLCFEQSHATVLPWLPGHRTMTARGTTLADLVEPKHPAFAGLEEDLFDTWNGDGLLYHFSLSPFDQSAIAIGGTGYVMSESFAGTVLADIALGEGSMLTNCFEVVDRYGTDPVATILANNLIRHIVSDNDEYALEVEPGRPLISLEPDDCVLFDLSAYCNNRFADPVANDGAGGWDDHGPDNDIREIPTGKQTLAGIPFRIGEPGEKNAPTCITVRSHRWPHHPEAITGIPIGGQFNSLLFLHTGTYVPKKKGQLVYTFRVQYERGGPEEIPIRAGLQVVDWTKPVDGLPGSVIAWSGHTGDGRMAAIFCTPWENPHPDRKIRSVDFVGAGAGVPVLIAITGYRGTLERGWLSKEHTHHK